MTWSVSLVVDPTTPVGEIDMLTRQMPVWALETNERQAAAQEIRAGSDSIWAPEPSLTLFRDYGLDAVALCTSILPTILEHHRKLARLLIFGLESTEQLTYAMTAEGFEQVEEHRLNGLVFRKPLDKLIDVHSLTLDMTDWRSADDLFDSFFAAVGAPPWHGKNYNALRDSIVTGDINQIEVPYCIQLTNFNRATHVAQEAAHRFVTFIDSLYAEGCPVSISR